MIILIKIIHLGKQKEIFYFKITNSIFKKKIRTKNKINKYILIIVTIINKKKY